MFKNKRHLMINSALIFLTGCASYNAASLSSLCMGEPVSSKEYPTVLVSSKVLSRCESLSYLDRDVLLGGYIPIQLSIQNNSNDPMYLSPSNFSIPLSSPSEVANQVHTSTGLRIATWGTAGLFFFPFFIPAIVDGFKSANANDALDADYAAKAVRDYTIQPHSSYNCIAFVWYEYADQPLNMYLVNLTTKEKVSFPEISTKK